MKRAIVISLFALPASAATVSHDVMVWNEIEETYTAAPRPIRGDYPKGAPACTVSYGHHYPYPEKHVYWVPCASDQELDDFEFETVERVSAPLLFQTTPRGAVDRSAAPRGSWTRVVGGPGGSLHATVTELPEVIVTPLPSSLWALLGGFLLLIRRKG